MKPNPKGINIILNILKGAQFKFLPRAPFYIDTPLTDAKRCMCSCNKSRFKRDGRGGGMQSNKCERLLSSSSSSGRSGNAAGAFGCCCLNHGCDFLTQHATSSTSKQSGSWQQTTDHAVPQSAPLTGTFPEDMDCSSKFRWKWLLDILMGGSGKITVVSNHRRVRI
jgi:hypothetical protein